MKSEWTLKPIGSWFELTPSTSARPKSSEQYNLSFFNLQILISHRQLMGRPAKAERLLSWKRKVDFDSLVKEMVKADLEASKSMVEDQN